MVHPLRGIQSEGQTLLNNVSAIVGRKEGRTDKRLHLSLVHLSHEVEKLFYLINNQDTAYAFPHELTSGQSEI